MGRAYKSWLVAASAALVLAGCATVVYNEPVNVPLSGHGLAERIGINFQDADVAESAVVGLAFSGGGTRAAAFSFGVLDEMERTPVRGASAPMIERLEFISGVSGGSVTAAYYGLRKRDGLRDFRERFLLRNAEENLTTTVSLATLSRALGGGVNDSTGLTRWLDANLFNGATFEEFRRIGRPRVWINASDIYNRTPFIFSAETFNAMCSDLGSYPLATAVAASAAVPIAFAPVVIKTYPGECNKSLPSWVTRSRDRDAPPMLRSFAEALSRYHDGGIPYVKLLDGGLVDNYGLSGFTIARLSSDTPYGPMSPRQAVKMRRALFLVVDSKKGLEGDWIRTVQGPTGVELVQAAADTAIDASVGASFVAFEKTISDWQGALTRWRCGLSAAERARYGAPANWNCRDIKFFVGRLGFDQLENGRAASLEKVPTRFNLPADQVDMVIEAGRDVFRASPVVKAFAASL